MKNRPRFVSILQEDQLLEAYPDPRPEHALCGLLDEIVEEAVAEARREEKAKNSFVIRKCKEPGGYLCMSYEPVIKPQFGSTPQEALENYLQALTN